MSICRLLCVSLMLCTATVCRAQMGGIGGNEFERPTVTTGDVGKYAQVINGVLVPRIMRGINARRTDVQLTAMQLLGVDGLPSGRRVYNLRIFLRPVNSDPVEKVALEVWEEVRSELERRLQLLERTDGREARLALAAERETLVIDINTAANEFAAAIDDLVGHQVGIQSNNRLPEELAAVRTRARELRLERTGINARRRALDERIDQTRRTAGAETKDHPMLAELRKAVALREASIASSRNHFGDDHPKVRAAQAALVQETIALRRAEHEINSQASGAVLQRLNDEMSAVIVQQTELDALAAEAESMLRELTEQLNVQIRAELESAALEQAVDRRRTTLARLRARKQLLDDQLRQPADPISIKPWDDAHTEKEGDGATKEDRG